MVCVFVQKLFPKQLASEFSEKGAENKKQQFFDSRYFSGVVERLKNRQIALRQKLQRQKDAPVHQISSAYYLFHLP